MNKTQILKDFRERFVIHNYALDKDMVAYKEDEHDIARQWEAKELEQFILTLVDQVRAETAKEIEKKLEPVFNDFSAAAEIMIQSKALKNTGKEILENLGYMKGVLYELKKEPNP